MAQREKKETELRAPESLTLCVNNCGFSGNPATSNMCQSCFQSAAGGGAVAPPPPPSCSPRSAVICPSDQPREARKEAEEEEDAPKAIKEAAAAAASASTPTRQVNRCSGCRKRVGLAGFRCRCGGLFCGEHRYSDRHDCSFDYKAAGRTAIASQNPVVRAAKIVRI